MEVTGRSEPERLARGGVRPGELRLADRGHARADDRALVVVAGGADFLGRAAANDPRLLDRTGCPPDRLALCRQATRERPTDQPVMVTKGKSGTGVPARLIIMPLEPEAARRARERARRNARHGPGMGAIGCSEAAIEMAGQLMLPTSLPGSRRDQGSPEDGLPVETWPPLPVLARYRLRWPSQPPT